MFTVCGQTEMHIVCPLFISTVVRELLFHIPHTHRSSSPHQAFSERFPRKLRPGIGLCMAYTRYPHIHIPNNNYCF